MVEEWKGLARASEDGGRTGRARWVSGCPVRAACGGVGGNRSLLLVPEPITSELWSEVTSILRNVRMDRLSEIDESGDPQESLSRRAKQPSAGGQMVVDSSKSGMQRAANPMQPRSPAQGRKVRPLSSDGILAER